MIQPTLSEPSDPLAPSAEESLKTEAKQALSETKSKLKREADRVAVKTREAAKEKADHYVDETCSHVRNVEDATREAAKQLREKQPGFVTDGVDYASDRIGDLASYFETRDSKDIADDTRSFVRKHPAIAIGGAILAGVAIGRFLKATPPTS